MAGNGRNMICLHEAVDVINFGVSHNISATSYASMTGFKLFWELIEIAIETV